MGEEESFNPRVILEIELDDRSVKWVGDESARLRRRAHVLVRLHSTPLGAFEMELPEHHDAVDSIFAEAAKQFAREISEHLDHDKIATALEVARSGEKSEPNRKSVPPCLEGRAKLLVDAPSVSVAVVTRNRPDLLKLCLTSIYELDYPDFEVIVVDSSSEDDSEILIEENFPNVRYVRNLTGGICTARNRCLTEANRLYLACTDDDAVVDKHWLSEMVLALESNPNVACVTGFVMPIELETPAQVLFEESGAFAEGVQRRRLDLKHREPGSLLPFATGRIGAGVNMAWRREVFEKIGYFDVALDRCGADDLAVFFDALCAGYEIVYEPGAIVWHRHRRTMEELRMQTLWHATGLGAYLTRCLVKQPGRIWDFLMRVPGGIRYGFSSSSVRNKAKSKTFPREITRQEWIGVAKGPAAYVKGSLAARRSRASS